MNKPQWMLDYEEAYLAANNRPARVVYLGYGWYGIEYDGPGRNNYRRADIKEMTQTLRQRVLNSKDEK